MNHVCIIFCSTKITHFGSDRSWVLKRWYNDSVPKFCSSFSTNYEIVLFIGNDQSCVLIPVPITLSEVLSVDQAHTVHRGRMLNPNDNSYCHYLDHCQYTVRGCILNPNDDCCWCNYLDYCRYNQCQWSPLSCRTESTHAE